MSNSSGAKFEPMDLTKAPAIECGLPPELWTVIQSTPAAFTPEYFLDVSRNLLENPNLTASYLSRAELSYTSFTDASFNPDAKHPHELANIVKHMKSDHQPRILTDGILGYKLEWTVVRKLIPRNPKLDESLLQTCHLFTSTERVAVQQEDGITNTIEADRYLVIYLPHVSDPESIPFYHPKVRGVAILYIFQKDPPLNTAPGTLSIYYDFFTERPLDNRMSRTALKMIEIIHKHSRGRMQGYQKRVHHDVVIPQKTFQDTYAYLKGKYAKELMENWVEATPASKHVFEDLGIAAFLIELWIDMYGEESAKATSSTAEDPNTAATENAIDHGTSVEQQRSAKAQEAFPGFVDIGCGNGLLVNILNREGWTGWGFDARRRKTWLTFSTELQANLKEMLLVPEVLAPSKPTPKEDVETENEHARVPNWHNGIPPTGTFIISNHADELTAWTPLLAYLSSSPFIAIPCCSHDLGGTRFRAPYHPDHFPPNPAEASSKSKPKQVSAYNSLCSYAAYLTATMGYVTEKEYLRIPSTRNIAIIGRRRKEEEENMMGFEEKMDFVRGVVEKEMGGDTSIEQVKMQWLKRGNGLLKPAKDGH